MNTDKVKSYYKKKESRWGYRLIMGGVRHIPYYPEGKRVTLQEALDLKMDLVGLKLNLSSGNKVLDAGCGEGDTAIYLAKNYGLDVTGVDLVDESIAAAKKKALRAKTPNVEFKTGDFLRLQYPNGYFDGVYAVETVTHSPDIEKQLKEFKRVLKPGGKLVIFDYEVTAQQDIKDKKIKWVLKATSRGWSAPGLVDCRHGFYRRALSRQGFSMVRQEDITKESLPFFRITRRLAFVPYYTFKIFGARERFINTTVGRWWLRAAKLGHWKIVIASALKHE